MKRAIVITIFFAVFLGYALWIFLELLERHQLPAPEASPEVSATTPTCEGNPYPDDLWPQLLRNRKTISISNHGMDELPDNLNWEWGAASTELGDALAERGGTMRLHNVGPFPANFLAFGSPTPQFFHYSLFECLEIPLVQRHPRTGEPVAGVANMWTATGKTIWFHINPNARYSNGMPVRGRDFALGILLRSRCSNNADWQMLVQAAKEVRFYGDEVIAITLRRKCPMALYLASAVLHPAEPGFYAEFGNDYTTRYAQRIPPTTGAYVVTKVEKGRLIRLERIPDWWGADIPQRRHTCNVDAIEHHFLADEAQAWELFLNGGLDAIQTRNMAAWQQKLDGVPAVENGDIIRHSLHVDYPLPPYGIALNAERIPDKFLRQGIARSLDMKKAIDILFRGEARQLNTFTDGYGALSPSAPLGISYSPKDARAIFDALGYTEQGPDGILRKPDGTRLSFKLTYTPSDKTNTLFTILAQSAKECGVELVADAEPWQNVADKVNEGTHELLFWSAAPSSLMPQPERFLHSSATGTDAPFRLKSPEMDDALKACYTAQSGYDLGQAVAKVDSLVGSLALWVPGWKEDKAHVAAWRHVKFPSRYGGPYDIMEAHTFWIKKKEEKED